MINDSIVAFPTADDVWTDETPRPSPSVSMADNGTDVAYLTNTDIADWPATAWLVGEWDGDTGEPLSAITDDYVNWIRPLGNADGLATGLLDSMRWQGHSEAKFFEYDDTDPEDVHVERYPADHRPFSLLIERQYIDDDGFPHIPNGWKVTMVSDDPARDITARAIGIYNDNGDYLYTTGAFVPDGDTYSTVCPVGQRTADEVQINFKLLLGSAPEGAWMLPVGEAEDTRQFWAENQA